MKYSWQYSIIVLCMLEKYWWNVLLLCGGVAAHQIAKGAPCPSFFSFSFPKAFQFGATVHSSLSYRSPQSTICVMSTHRPKDPWHPSSTKLPTAWRINRHLHHQLHFLLSEHQNPCSRSCPRSAFMPCILLAPCPGRYPHLHTRSLFH